MGAEVRPYDRLASHSGSTYAPRGGVRLFVQRAIIEVMGTLRITEAELARDVHGVLAKVREGVEVVVESDHRPVATIKAPVRGGRLISECIASARATGSGVTLDEGFGRDVEDGIRERSQPWNPPDWD
jgi:antitoxin (DNA-binding transcriptional repressor) of toxin-antitoxin stability system